MRRRWRCELERKVVKETVIDEDGNATVKTRISIGDPPNVTFREGMAMYHLVTTKPQQFIPSNPTPVSISIQFTPAIIHPWYLAPIRQCLVCRAIYQQNLIRVSDNFDLCETCVRSWQRHQINPTKSNWTNMREPTRTLIYQTLDLEDIVESYYIPGGTFKIVFLWVRYSPPGFDPPVGSYSYDFLLKSKPKGM